MSDDLNLFGVPAKRKKTKAPPAANGAVQQAIRAYVGFFGTRFHEKPVITPADGKAVKQLVTQFGLDKFLQRLPLYVALDDAYLHDAGYPLRLMPGQWNRLTVQLQRRPTGTDQAVERTRAYLQRLRGGATSGH